MELDALILGRERMYVRDFDVPDLDVARKDREGALRWQAYAQDDESARFLVKTWSDTSNSRCLFEYNATKILMEGGGEAHVLMPVDVIVDKSKIHFVYPFVEGRTLERQVVGNKIASGDGMYCGERDFGFVLHVLEGVARGLEYCHTKGIVHRDVKPANILLRYDVDSRHGFMPLLCDWDIAGVSGKVQQGESCYGTPEFMPPEQFYQNCVVQPYFDQYALGMTMYWVMNNRVAIPSGKTYLEIYEKQKGVYRYPVASDIPKPIAHEIEKMVARDINERHMNLSKMVERFSDAVAQSQMSYRGERVGW